MIGDVEKPEDSKRLVGHQYTVGFDLGNGRQIQVTGNFFRDEDAADMSASLDRLMFVLERQRAKCEIAPLEAELRTRRKMVQGIKEQIARLEVLQTKHKGGLNAQNNAALENHRVNLERAMQDVLEGEAALDEAKKKAA